jgi:glucose/arabinose dehydrogenase
VRPDDERYATIVRQKKANNWADWEIVAKGVRNTVGFDCKRNIFFLVFICKGHPITKELWFTDNGRDFMEHNLPPDELNRVTKIGASFGFPYCYGHDHRDKEILANETVDCKKQFQVESGFVESDE